MPTSGLAAHRSVTPRTSANFRLFRKCERKRREAEPAREKLQILPTMIVQEARENRPRMIGTAFAVGPAERKSWTMFDPPLCVIFSILVGMPRHAGRARAQGSTENSRRSKRWLLAAALLTVLVSPLSADPPEAPAPDPGTARILPLSEVKEGMKGYGLTVVKGDRIERFGVEVIGVVP